MLAAAAAQTTREISTARAALRGAAARKDEFGKMIQTRRTEAVAAASALAELDELRIRADETRAVLRAVRDEITSISVDSNAPARVKLAGEASVPFIPDGGKRLQLLFMVVIGALTAGLGAGTLCELNDHTVRTIEDVASICDKPILCAVPDFSDSAPSLSAMTLVQEKPSTVAAHEIRKIVPYLTASALRDGVRSCVMVSAERHDGRTFLACNLAIALAQANRRVLLVETSPQAKAEGALGLDRDAGISDILCSQSSFPDCVRHTPIANLFFIGIGTRSDMISAKIASRDMMQLLRHAEQCFDHVIIDTPCFTDMADAGVLAQLANATIAVVRLDSSNVQAVHSMIQMLNRCRVGVLGVAVNAWRRRDAFEFIRGRLRAGVLKLQRAAPVSAYAAAEPYSGTGQVERDRD